MNHDVMGRGPLRAHIIDDDAGDRKMLRRALRSGVQDAEISESASVSDALSNPSADSLDVVLLDFFIGETDGLTGLQQIKEAWPTTAVIMVTGSGDEQLATSALHSGATHYVPKSRIDAASMKTVVDKAIAVHAMRKRLAEKHEEMISFTHVLSHDFVAPMLSIEGLASLALEEDPANDRVRFYLNEILKCAHGSQSLIQSLTEHLQSDGYLALEPCDMHQVLDRALTNLRMEIADAGAAIQVDDLPIVLGNAAQLTLLLQNLISNAIKYNESPMPTISLAIDDDVPGESADEITICVRDNGIGIDHEAAERIFEPFRRLHGAEHYNGSGLGLATCRKIVERHGGRIWCEPGHGSGTAFLFTLRTPPRPAVHS